MFAKLGSVLAAAAMVWALLPHASNGAGRERVYVVRPADTLWSIAASRYGGDPRDGVWKLERRNHLKGVTLRPGQRLIVP